MPLHWPMFSAAFTRAAVLFPMCSSMVLHLALERLGVIEPADGRLVEPAVHVPAVYLDSGHEAQLSFFSMGDF